MKQKCPRCKGKGEVETEVSGKKLIDLCPRCKGEGFLIPKNNPRKGENAGGYAE